MKRLIFLLGIPASGKSRFIDSYVFNSSYNIVCPDYLRKQLTGNISNQDSNKQVWQKAKILIVKHLSEGNNVILDATNVQSHLRQQIINYVKNDVDGVNLVAIIFNVDPKIAKERIKKDIQSGKDRANVPEHVIDNMYTDFINGYEDIFKQFDKVYEFDESEKHQLDLKQLK